MKYFSIAAVVLAIVISPLIFKGPIFYEKLSGISLEKFECGKNLAHVTLDNPVERILIKRVKIGRVDAGKIVATAYFVGGIKYARILIHENCSGSSRI